MNELTLFDTELTEETTGTVETSDGTGVVCPCCNGTGVREAAGSGRAVTERPSDPSTSAAAGAAVRSREGQQVGDVRPGTQRHKMLAAFGKGEMTDSEAASVAGLNRPSVCYWKRASELRQAGYIVPTGAERVDPDSGKNRAVCAITLAGIKALAALGDGLGANPNGYP